MKLKFEYMPRQKKTPMLFIAQFLFQRYAINEDGSIRWRCKEARSEIKCKAHVRLEMRK